MRRMTVVAIVPSAGRGKRLRTGTRKPFVPLRGKPLVSYTLKALNSSNAVDAIVVACERSCVKAFHKIVKRFKLEKVIDIVVGGKTRFESVKNCLDKIGPFFDLVLIHDGARPFVSQASISESVKTAGKFGACIVAVPESDTVKLSDAGLFAVKTLPRNRLFRAQTPQAFRYSLIKKAYEAKPAGSITDDASLVEMLGKRVKIVPGSYRNIKITTKEDLKIAEALL